MVEEVVGQTHIAADEQLRGALVGGTDLEVSARLQTAMDHLVRVSSSKDTDYWSMTDFATPFLTPFVARSCCLAARHDDGDRLGVLAERWPRTPCASLLDDGLPDDGRVVAGELEVEAELRGHVHDVEEELDIALAVGEGRCVEGDEVAELACRGMG